VWVWVWVFTLWGVSALSPPIAAPLGDVTTERLRLRRFARADFDELASVFERRGARISSPPTGSRRSTLSASNGFQYAGLDCHHAADDSCVWRRRERDVYGSTLGDGLSAGRSDY
jgi:hypothetical protein